MAGGIERMSIAIMNDFVRRGHDVALITWDKKDAAAFYKMDSRIAWHRLNIGDPALRAGVAVRVRRALAVRRLVRAFAPDVMIGFQHGTFLGLRIFTALMNIPVIAAERSAPDRFAYSREGRNREVILQSMRLADAVTIQCESYRASYPAYLHARMHTIPNPVFPADHYADPRGGAGAKMLLSVGRLSYQKNYPVLLKAFAALASDHPDWSLTIAGEGEAHDELLNMIAALNMQGRIHLLGAVQDVASLYRRAQLFCLPSLWEGFPNALAEAMAHGLPCVGFAQCAGVRDLIRDGENGALAAGQNDADALADTLRTLMGDDDMRARLGHNAIKSVAAYAPDQIFAQWETLFRDVASR